MISNVEAYRVGGIEAIEKAEEEVLFLKLLNKNHDDYRAYEEMLNKVSEVLKDIKQTYKENPQ